MVLTGGLATGKTAVAQEVISVAAHLGLRAAAIDLDWLGWTTGAESDVEELIGRNLAAVAANYAAAGVDHLVLARALLRPRALEALAAVLPGWVLAAVRLEARRTTLERRLRIRDSGAELRNHLDELDDMTRRVAAAAPKTAVVVNDGRELRAVALEVMRLVDWIDVDTGDVPIPK